MQEQKFEELENRASRVAELDDVRKAEARSRVHQTIEQMKAEGKAFELTSEEEEMIQAFRRFKLRMRKNGEVFTWQSHCPEGVEIVQETGEIIHPREAGAPHLRER